MYEIDFLPVESEDGNGSKSGDAIALRFTTEQSGRQVVVVIDGGYTAIGEQVSEHIRKHYETYRVDLVISTHPDADHLNGLKAVIENCDVQELMVHQPRNHARSIRGFSNLEALDDLVATAQRRGTKVSEPFTGETRFDGQLTILGPTKYYYKYLLDQYLVSLQETKSASFSKSLLGSVRDLLRNVLASFPRETLSDEVTTSERNNSSVVTLLQCDGKRLIFTGDAGIPALERAADHYEGVVGGFDAFPLHFLQAPHHGSRHNLGPSVLNRILGPTESPYGSPTAFVSSAKASEKHPSPKVVNALGRRGASVYPTEGRTITHNHKAPPRPGSTAITPLPPLAEPEDN